MKDHDTLLDLPIAKVHLNYTSMAHLRLLHQHLCKRTSDVQK